MAKTKCEYYIRLDDETIEEAKRLHQGFYGHKDVAYLDAKRKGTKGDKFTIRRATDDRTVKRGRV